MSRTTRRQPSQEGGVRCSRGDVDSAVIILSLRNLCYATFVSPRPLSDAPITSVGVGRTDSVPSDSVLTLNREVHIPDDWLASVYSVENHNRFRLLHRQVGMLNRLGITYHRQVGVLR